MQGLFLYPEIYFMEVKVGGGGGDKSKGNNSKKVEKQVLAGKYHLKYKPFFYGRKIPI